MKKLLFLFTLMLSPLLVSAQTVSDYSYHPFLKEGKTWNCRMDEGCLIRHQRHHGDRR